MCLVPALVILVVYGHFGWALVTFLVAGVTDALDGVFARARHEQTQLGTLLDPLADKLLVVASIVILSTPNPALTVRIPVWVAILTISRDAGILIAVILINLAIGKRIFPPTMLGKVTTTVQLATILWIFWCNYRGTTGPMTTVLLALMVGLTIVSGLHYIYRARRIIGDQGESLEA
jgi:cardiolipin synthase